MNSPLAGLNLQEIDLAAGTRYIVWRLGHGRSNGTILKEVSWLKAAIDAADENRERMERVARRLRPFARGAVENVIFRRDDLVLGGVYRPSRADDDFNFPFWGKRGVLMRLRDLVL